MTPMPRTLAGKDKAASRARWVGLHTPDVGDTHAFQVEEYDADDPIVAREEWRHPPDY